MRPAILVALLALTIGSHDECTDAYQHCIAHAATEQQKRACRAQYLECARRIGTE